MVGEQAVPPTDAVWDVRKRRASLISGVTILALMVVGIFGAFLAIVRVGDERTSTPTKAVEAFLKAVVLDKSETTTQSLVCSTWTAQDAMATVNRLTDPEAIKIDWEQEIILAQPDSSHATVRVTIRIFYPGDTGAPSGQENWTLTLALDGTWKVCSVSDK